MKNISVDIKRRWDTELEDVAIETIKKGAKSKRWEKKMNRASVTSGQYQMV